MLNNFQWFHQETKDWRICRCCGPAKRSVPITSGWPCVGEKSWLLVRQWFWGPKRALLHWQLLPAPNSFMPAGKGQETILSTLSENGFTDMKNYQHVLASDEERLWCFPRLQFCQNTNILKSTPLLFLCFLEAGYKVSLHKPIRPNSLSA